MTWLADESLDVPGSGEFIFGKFEPAALRRTHPRQILRSKDSGILRRRSGHLPLRTALVIVGDNCERLALRREDDSGGEFSS